MQGVKFNKLISLTALALLLSGCAYPISKQLREEARPDLTFPVVHENPGPYFGSVVIWGGQIIETVNYPDHTDITVLQTPLSSQDRPESASKSQGRFIARSKSFLDPAIFKKGRMVTVAGEIIGQDTLPLGQSTYTYPVISIREIHLWEPKIYPPPYYWGPPYWGPYWGWGPWSPYWGPYYGGP